MSKVIVAYGELLWDLLPSGEALGGAPANFAYRIKERGGCVYLVSRVGDDERGKDAASILYRKGLSPEFIQWDKTQPTGSVPVTVDANGSPEYTILPNVAYDFIEVTPELEKLFAEASAVCFGTLIQRSSVSRETLRALLRKTKGIKFLDLNLRKDCFSDETIDASLGLADALKLNENEAQHVARMYGIPEDGFAQTAVAKWDLQCCVITLGEKGSIAADKKEIVRSEAPQLKDPVIDTVGCGDAFSAAFVHQLLAGASLVECCAAGNRLGAAVARTRGGMGPVSI